MLQGLSRKSLNIIILVCLVVITWLNLAGGEDQEPPLEPLALPPLHDPQWQIWPNNEGVTVLLRAGGTIKGGTLAIRGAEQTQQIALPNASWTIPLYRALDTAPAEEPAALLISGPWPASEKQAMAALVIREQKLQPLATTTESWPQCIRSHMPGALWLAQQQGKDWQQLGQLADDPAATGITPPAQQAWAVWRLQQSRELRRRWQNEQTQIDIQADLAYHRLPFQAYSQLYESLADARPGEVRQVQNCLTRTQAPENVKAENPEANSGSAVNE
ncbi:MAG: hypothetical protein CMH98_10430 [Oceanospirillaceae bacterium]|nr:hypothetical protein [Oceanospirillaceae bacterium]|tara:strand:+ start:31594 stop:32415 length:822 start_codon:yes stop_codon:yes gene_type:complete